MNYELVKIIRHLTTIIKDIRRAERFIILIIVKSSIKKIKNAFSMKNDTTNGIHEINRLTASFDIAIMTASRNQTINTIRTAISGVIDIHLINLVLALTYIKNAKTKIRLKSSRTLHLSNMSN
ncbi:MAG: hypothetical protein ACTSXW_07990 [Candidatus Baldrarchaeia archaeon]